jgi:hypothetical protein
VQTVSRESSADIAGCVAFVCRLLSPRQVWPLFRHFAARTVKSLQAPSDGGGKRSSVAACDAGAGGWSVAHRTYRALVPRSRCASLASSFTLSSVFAIAFPFPFLGLTCSRPCCRSGAALQRGWRRHGYDWYGAVDCACPAFCGAFHTVSLCGVVTGDDGVLEGTGEIRSLLGPLRWLYAMHSAVFEAVASLDVSNLRGLCSSDMPTRGGAVPCPSEDRASTNAALMRASALLIDALLSSMSHVYRPVREEVARLLVFVMALDTAVAQGMSSRRVVVSSDTDSRGGPCTQQILSAVTAAVR